LAGIFSQSPGKPKSLGPVISEGATPSTAQLATIAANANRTIAGTIQPGLFFIIFAPSIRSNTDLKLAPQAQETDVSLIGAFAPIAEKDRSAD